ncbi:hypothetical protein [Streptomyces antibioticus]|uniref:Uncharacterized protein n=1 Tax=Streptomyces antibioticus TaxID=1890 RepID=A0AAE7CNM1_STRAT|nr:hypothetical protein [Streptomyces antibioticus]OOQ47278.1 hypothetical protein AFM16_31550 [Streptomyces antibioticus]QIT47602.1 hypothetical protein HCX60_32105 [Streptomyces antibioticus]
MNTTDAHLWEVDHPYYCSEGNFFKTGQHEHFASWQDFTAETGFVDGDRDMNFLIRWDWRKPGHHGWDGDEYLLLFFVLQRKAWLLSKQIPVTEADEPAVRAFLADCAATMRAVWEPLLEPAPAAAAAGTTQDPE